jgi:predicted SAM-dependent methyltransferase
MKTKRGAPRERPRFLKKGPKMNPKNAFRKFYMSFEPYFFVLLSPLLRSRYTRTGRSLIAQKYLTGSGLEIGAFASPTMVPLGAHVKYVDRVPASHWRDYPEYEDAKPVDPDIIDDGARIASVPDASVDFVMCFHMLEHVPNAMEAVRNWIRALKPSGVLIVSVPDKRYTWDKDRDTTPLEHFIRDFEDGPDWGAEEHYRDFAKNVKKLTEEEEIKQFIIEAPPAIHFHVWDVPSFFMFLHKTSAYFGTPLDILEVMRNHNEIIAVLQRR